MRPLALITTLGCLTACLSGALSPVGFKRGCETDSDCQSNEICFPDGCGDPGQGLVVEVTPNARAGLQAQDVAITALTASFDLQLSSATSVTGELQKVDGATLQPVLYTDQVTVRASGESVLIPGVVRTYQTTVPTMNMSKGTFELFVGSGRYSVSALATDKSIPAATQTNVVLDPGDQHFLRFDFLVPLSLSGRLLKRVIPGTPDLQLPPTQVAMDIQAFDPISGSPLSQRSNVSSGFPASTGDFVLSLSPDATSLSSISLVASPREATALVPTKTFTISWPFTDTVTLELGDYGDSLPQLSGSVLDANGAPVAGASVTFEGAVGGGGVFVSRTVTTDARGGYLVDLLPSPLAGSYDLTVVPPASSSAGILRIPVRAQAVVGSAPRLSPSTVTCPARVLATGVLLRPDFTPASGVPVTAIAVDSLDDRPLPVEPTTTTTASDGSYSLLLDPAVYRLEFVPGQPLPMRARLATIGSSIDVDAGVGLLPVDLKTFTLLNGRTLSGTVTTNVATPLSPVYKEAATATMRFFRVSPVGGKQSSLLLGEAVTDEHGRYSVVLPAH